ncbi:MULTISPECIES: hypothetical protein [Salinibaculum]|uniref:hypothetical protein n=1 Tax=Salinibaculum TaxID=2732368 RepID=UPI0030D4A48C
MTGWRDRVDQLLYDGESVRETVAFDDASVVVTSHRVLAFTPEADGANFQQVDRPNVDGVGTSARSKAGLLERGIRYGLVGAVLVVAGQFVNLDGLVGGVDLQGQATGELGLGGIMGTLQTMLNLLTRLDQLLQVVGALALLLAVVLLGVYWVTREATLVVEVAGGDDIHVPRPSDATDARDRLAAAVSPRTDEAREQGNVGDPLGES